MIDLIFTAIDWVLTEHGNPDWGKASTFATKEGDEAEAWANSEHELVLGDKTSWAIGLGNTSNTFGPRIEFIVDYSYFLTNILEKSSWGHYLSPLAVGT
ncbi:MAG: hypothetical protein ACKO9Z_16645, partial [Planctomycetota bacterium]